MFWKDPHYACQEVWFFTYIVFDFFCSSVCLSYIFLGLRLKSQCRLYKLFVKTRFVGNAHYSDLPTHTYHNIFMLFAKTMITYLVYFANRYVSHLWQFKNTCLYFVSPRERPWRQHVFWRKTLVIARATCALSHALKKEHWD